MSNNSLIKENNTNLNEQKLECKKMNNDFMAHLRNGCPLAVPQRSTAVSGHSERRKSSREDVKRFDLGKCGTQGDSKLFSTDNSGFPTEDDYNTVDPVSWAMFQYKFA